MQKQKPPVRVIPSGNKSWIYPAQRTLRDDLGNLKKMGLIDTTGHAKTATWFLLNKH